LGGGQIVIPSAQGILWFQPRNEKSAKPWQQAGDFLVKGPGVKASRSFLMDDAGFVHLSWTADATKLKVQIGQIPGDEKIRTLEVKLPAPLQGTPALGAGYALLPLANGIVVRMSLSDGALVNGPDWRALGAEEGRLGHVVELSPGEFLLTDGSRGIARMVWTDGKSWDKQGGQLAHRTVRPPVVVPATPAARPRVCVLDASDTLTLLDAERLSLLRSWPMPGKVTAGPFVRGGKIGCVVGRNQLVWLDPEQEKAAWAYGFDADVVGAPHIIDGMLIVGDVAGQFIALDPVSGRPLGVKRTLKANVAPTVAPLPYGAGRAFVPLTDGTILLLPLEKLR
jgi:outer membrane protein assembly factor BamB